MRDLSTQLNLMMKVGEEGASWGFEQDRLKANPGSWPCQEALRPCHQRACKVGRKGAAGTRARDKGSSLMTLPKDMQSGMQGDPGERPLHPSGIC